MTKRQTINDKLVEAFEEVKDNPTSQNIKKYKELENALLALWLKELFSDIAKGINENIQKASNKAIKRLQAKGLKKAQTKTDLIKRLAYTKKEEVKSDLNKAVSNVKANSSRMISTIEQERITPPSNDKKTSWSKILALYGLAYFTDKSGRAWTLDRYGKLVQDTAEYTSYRDTLFARSLEYNSDLVRVIHNGNEPPCELCDPFQGKILSLTGKTSGYMTVDEAKSYGLFHPNCYCDFELAPDEHSGDKEVIFSEANEKQRTRYEQGNRKAVIVDEPLINNKNAFSDFGREYKGVKGQEAINLLLKEQQGYVKDAFSRKDLGGIALIWGDNKKGLSHIIKRRKDTNQDIGKLLSGLTDIVETGSLEFNPKTQRFEISKDGRKVIVSPQYKGEKLNFILTAFEIYK